MVGVSQQQKGKNRKKKHPGFQPKFRSRIIHNPDSLTAPTAKRSEEKETVPNPIPH